MWIAKVPTDLPPQELANWQKRPIGFFTAMIDTARGWMDRLQEGTPGYCERIVHIGQSSKEGGMNLDMSADVINGLVARGQIAGKLLLKHYPRPAPALTTPTDLNTRHQWTRLRTTAAAAQRWTEQFNRGITGDDANQPPRDWAEMLTTYLDIGEPNFAVPVGQADPIEDLMDALVAAVQDADAFATDPSLPTPVSDLRVFPPT